MPADQDPTRETPGAPSPLRPPASFLDRPAAEYAAALFEESRRQAEVALQASLGAALAGRYHIVGEIGRGGMAIVYRADDLRHGRPVAIKVVRPELARELGAARFLHEIAVVARLQHPHIVSLLDSGAVEGLPYYVMPRVDGETLRERLRRESRVPVEDALRIASEVADALDYAHARGVLHRDVKPDNILLQARHALVADFGIARALTRAAGDTVTSASVTLGTPAYMSPEQAAGEMELDGRSDIFSLGVVLHEMLAGEAPFRGATPQAVIAQVISAPAPSITDVREGVPPSVQRILARALAKEPAERFQSAGEMREAIEAALAGLAHPVAPAAAAQPVESQVDASATEIDLHPTGGVHAVAGRDAGQGSRSPFRRRWRTVLAEALVLVMAAGMGPVRPPGPQGPVPWILLADFEASGDNPNLVTAVRDLLGLALDESGVVTTVPRERMRQGLRLAGRPDTARIDEVLGRELAIRASIASVLTGRVDRVGGTYSLLFRVIDADSGTTLLTEREVADGADDVIPAVDRASRRLRGRLRERRGALRSTRPLAEVATPSLAAFLRYVESEELTRTRGSVFGVPPLRDAIALDPAFASAWFRLGIHFNNFHQYDTAAAAFAQARRHAARLSDQERLLLDAWEARLRRDFVAALAIYDRALRRNPKDSRAQTGRAIVLERLGRFEEGLDAHRRALANQPFGPSVITLGNLSGALMSVGRWDEAAEVERKMSSDWSSERRLVVALGTDDWPTADSLGRSLAERPGVVAGPRRSGMRAVASALAARGEVRAADSVLTLAHAIRPRVWAHPFQESVAERDRLLLAFSTGAHLGPSGRAALGRATVDRAAADRAAVDSALESDVLTGIWGPASRDPASARRALVAIRTWPPLRQAALGVAPKLLAAMIAADAEHWREVVNLLAADAAGTHNGEGTVPMWMHARWLVARAYERLEQPDSAAWYLHRLLDPVEAVRNGQALSRGLVYSFAHQRLVVLYARLGRIEDARRHWRILQATFTRPDPELVPLVEEARTALAKAERERG